MCGSCNSALPEGARFCSACGASRKFEAMVAVGERPSFRSLLSAPEPTVAAVERRLADEGWSLEPAVVRGLSARRSPLIRTVQPVAADVSPDADAFAPQLIDIPVTAGDHRSLWARVCGAARD